MNNCKNRLWAAAALGFGALVLAAPQAAAEGFAAGTALCLQSVLPALFPFFVVCELLTAAPPPAWLLRPVQKALGLEMPDAAQAVLLAWLGGYAVCARLAGQLYGAGRITQRDAVLLQILGCCSGPGFVVGCVGGLLLGNVRVGVVLYAAQIAANLGAGAVVCFFRRGAPVCAPAGQASIFRASRACRGKHCSPADVARYPVSGMANGHGRTHRCAPTADGERQPIHNAPAITLPSAISSAVTSSLSVCGCVVFFRIVGAVVRAVVPLPAVVVSAVLEVSAGCADFAVLGGQAALYGCCGVLSLLGVSVWAQMQLFAGAAFCPKALLGSRIVHFFLLQGLVRLGVRALPGAVTACSTLAARVVPLVRLPPDAAALGFVFLCAALYKVRQNLYNE